jgi:hypothetical protein
VISCRGRLPLGFEYLGRQQERPTVARRLVPLLAEGHRHPASNANPAPLGPGLGRGIEIDQHGRLPHPDQMAERSLPEHVIGGDHQEQALPPHRVFRGGE